MPVVFTSRVACDAVAEAESGLWNAASLDFGSAQQQAERAGDHNAALAYGYLSDDAGVLGYSTSVVRSGATVDPNVLNREIVAYNGELSADAAYVRSC